MRLFIYFFKSSFLSSLLLSLAPRADREWFIPRPQIALLEELAINLVMGFSPLKTHSSLVVPWPWNSIARGFGMQHPPPHPKLSSIPLSLDLTLSLGFKIFSCKTERIVIATLWSYYCWGLNDLIHVKALTPITSLFSLPLSSQPIQPPSALLSTRRTPCTHQCWAETALVLLFVVFWATHLWVSSHLLGILYTVVWMAHSTIVDLFPPF